MEYRRSSIIYKRNIVFDNGDRDPRHGHPTFIPITCNPVLGDVYYLVITSKIRKYQKYRKEYYLLDEEKSRQANLTVPSMINLKEIYKSREFGSTIGSLPLDVYGEIIEKFKQCQNKNPHRYYAQVRQLL